MANRFRLTHNPTGAVPVPIEQILEIELEEPFDIIPVQEIYKDLNVYGCISFDKHSIYVDAELPNAKGDNYEYPFTLAHEFAHFVLHGELFDNAHTRSIHDLNSLKAYYKSIPDEKYRRAEGEATQFAALLLVPQDSLLQRFDRLVSKFEKANRAFSDLTSQQQEYILVALSFQFEVPIQYMTLRVRQDGLFN